MYLKHRRDIGWHDLPRLEHPFFARSHVEQAFNDRYGFMRLTGLDSVLSHQSYNRTGRRDRYVLDQLLGEVEHGDVFLVYSLSQSPITPLVKWEVDKENKDKGAWVVQASLYGATRLNVQCLITEIQFQRTAVASRPTSSWWDKTVGGTKEILNQTGKRNAAMLADSMGLHPTEIATGREIDLATEGKDVLPLANADEAEGAQFVREHQATAATVALIMALTSKFRSVVRKPKNFAADLKKAIIGSRSRSEAMGKAGLEQGKRRLGHQTDPRYKDRYHGPDDMTKKDGKLTEWEAKGNKTNSKAVAKDKNKNKQGSSKKNAKRAETMIGKNKKVGLPSNRQGGAYTQDEISLWRDIANRDGNKQHVSVHTNTETGQVKVYERDYKGNITKPLDEFKMENFDEMKQAIGEAFKK